MDLNDEIDCGELALSEPFYAPSTEGALDHLFARRDCVKARIEAIGGFLDGESRYALACCLRAVEVKRRDRGGAIQAEELLDVPGAVAALDAGLWDEAMRLTDVMECMPQERRDEWRNQIHDHKTPEFVPDNVLPTFEFLLTSRAKFFAERVDGVFRALSRSHVTNQPEGFGKRMILPYVVSEWGRTPEYRAAGYIHDLRCVVARFMGRDDPHHNDSHRAITVASQDAGQWISIDGGALRLRVYNGVRTGHLEIHPDMAWRLNSVLHSLHPMAIPSQFREPPKRKVREFSLMQKPLPFEVIGLLRELAVKGGNASLGWGAKPDKAQLQRLGEVLEAIGGVEAGDGWSFDYSPKPVIDRIICSGCIPDAQSHQFYPTPEHIAHEAVDAAIVGHKAGMRWLEPSAGTGNLAALFPDDAMSCLYDVSALHVEVLNARGFAAIEHDFLKTGVAERFDRVVMNPPYSEGRWKAHVEHAAAKTLPGGRLVAVLPESARGKFRLSGWETFWGEVHAFPGTSIKVSVMTAVRADA